jgi:hypothetical protein
MKKISFMIFALLSAFAGAAHAEYALVLGLDRTEITFNDTVKLTVSVNGARNSDTPNIPGLKDFYSENAGSSSRVQIINGNFSSSIDFAFLLQPKKLGTFTIGPATVTIQGKVYRSEAVTLRVAKSTLPENSAGKEVFLLADLSVPHAYVEEYLRYTLKLYHAVNISNLSLNLPETKSIHLKKQGKEFEYETRYQGKSYRVIQIDYQLIPFKKGEFLIPPARMSMVIQANTGHSASLFDDPFFSSQARRKNISSKSLVLKVSDIPSGNQPTGFSGLVGEFTLNSSLAPQKILLGESVTLTIAIQGTGNINRMPDIKLVPLKQIKAYKGQDKLDESNKEGQIWGTKEMKWALVPDQAGTFDIPPISVHYFNSRAKKFMELSTKPFTLEVSANSNFSNEQKEHLAYLQSLDKKERIRELAQDILPIKSSVRYLYLTSPIHSVQGIFWLMLFIPPLAYLSIFTFAKIRQSNPEREKEIYAQRAAKTFIKKSADSRVTASFLAEALQEYFNKRFGLKLGAITQMDIKNILAQRGVNPELINELNAEVAPLESAVYTGQGQKEYPGSARLGALIRRLEKELK